MLRLFTFLLLFLQATLTGLAQEGSFSWSAGNALPLNTVHTERFTNWGHPPVITVQIAGKKYRFLLDTGAPTVISSALRSSGTQPVLGTVRVTDALGYTAQTEVVRLPAISLGAIRLTGIPALVYEDANPVFEQLGVAGILGSNALAGLSLTFSAQQNAITFTVGSVLPTAGEQMSLTEDAQGTPAIPVALAGGTPCFLLFDSGFEGLCDLAPAAARQVTSTTSVAVRLLQSGSGFTSIQGSTSAGETLRLPQLTIAGHTLQNVAASVTGDSRSKIGASLLQLGDVTLDYRTARFLFVPYRR